MKINLHIDYEGGVGKDIIANAADMVAFEEKYGISIASLGNEPKLSYLYYLAWHSEKRTGATKDNFEEWLDKIETVTGAGDADPKSKV